ncbi:MAG TPA: efflux RND transporter permease subunit [Coriobacteriia bacterium]|nr:efflux RND transporter permease subunit [Coriobacteriia bacterium]
MDRITRFSLKNGAAIVILAILVMVGGLYSAMSLSKESMPDVNIPIVAVVTPYPGAAPQDVYDNITDPVEKALRGVAGVKQVSAQSGDSVSMVVAEFSYSQDMEKAEAEVNKALAGVKVPDNALKPTVSRISFGSSPILKLAIVSDKENAEALRSEVRDSVIPSLKGVEGVGDAKLAADAPYSVRIELDPVKLKKKGLTAESVIQQLQAANLSFPVGAVDLGDSQEPIRVGGDISSVDDIKKFKVAVYPNQNEIMGKAFAQIGSGMGALGEGMGALAQGMGQGFSALGGGMGQLGQATGEVAMQAGLINGIQQLQGQMYALKYDTLPQLRAAASQMPSNTPEYASMQGQITYIENQALPGMQSAVDGMQSKISTSQQQMQASASSMGAASSATSSGMRMPSGGSTKTSAGSTPDMKIKVVKLGDVAKVTYGPADGTVGSRANSQPAALIDIIKTQDANTVEVTEKVRAEMDRIAGTLPGDAKVEYVFDAADGINASIEGMLREGVLGAIFAVVVILLFLRNWRATLIATVSIPLSILIAMAALGGTDITLNVMTLGGLTVAIGRVVDDAIVVIENIFRHLQEGAPRDAETIRKATAEVSSAITSSTLTTVAVFIPLGLVSGIIGKIFQPFAWTVGISLLASLLVAVTVVPLMAKWMLLRGKLPKHRDEAVNPSKSGLFYRGILRWALDHRGAVVVVSVAMLVGAVALMPLIGTGFVPETKEKSLSVAVEYPEGTKAGAVDKTVRQVEAVLADTKDVDFYQSTVGASSSSMSMDGNLGGTNKASLFVRLDSEADTDGLMKALREKTDVYQTDGAKITFAAVSSAGGSGALEVIVTGKDLGAIRTASDQLVTKLKGVEDLENVSSNLGVSRPQIVVDVDEAKAAKYGLNAAMIAGTVRGLVAEQKVGSIKIDDQPTEVMYTTKLSAKDRDAKMSKLKLTTPLGKKIALTKVASVVETGSPVAVLTRDGEQYATVSGHISARDSGSVISDVKKEIAEVKLPEGVSVEVSGQAEMMSESFSQLGLAMLFAIGAVYLVMVIAFGEAAAPLAIMMSLPLAVVGGLIGLFIAGVPLDMPAMVGALMLIGIVVTNAIVLVDRVRSNLVGGMVRRDALLEAGTTRMRPILMTAVATIMALIPLASGGGEGALISQSLAVIVIGGLSTSTLLTLVVVPVAYDLLEGAKDRMFGRKHGAELVVEPDAA